MNMIGAIRLLDPTKKKDGKIGRSQDGNEPQIVKFQWFLISGFELYRIVTFVSFVAGKSQILRQSMDWFKRKSTGNHRIFH